MAMTPMEFDQNQWSDSGNTYTDLIIYRCGKLRVVTGYFSGSHAADIAMWSVNDIDKPQNTSRFGMVGTNKCVMGYLNTYGYIAPSQATDFFGAFNFSYIATTDA